MAGFEHTSLKSLILAFALLCTVVTIGQKITFMAEAWCSHRMDAIERSHCFKY